MSTYILILLISGTNSVSTSHVEFSSKQACSDAANQMTDIDESPSDLLNLDIYAVCVKK